MRDSLLHDSGLGAAATISARVAERAAPGGRRARRACTGICLHACLLRAAARGGLPGMHWDFSYPAGWLAEVLPDIVCLWYGSSCGQVGGWASLHYCTAHSHCMSEHKNLVGWWVV